jgi:DNA-binding transcriptional MerR regulator
VATDLPEEPEDSLRSKALRALERSPYEPFTGSSGMPARPADEDVDHGFSGKRAADVVGISYRQLDYWARTDLIRPSIRTDEEGRRRYSYRNLLELKLVKTLLDNGLKLDQVRRAFQFVRDQIDADVTALKLVIAGSSVVIVRENDDLIDIVNRYQGEGVINLIALDGVREQVDRRLDLMPDEPPV